MSALAVPSAATLPERSRRAHLEAIPGGRPGPSRASRTSPARQRLASTDATDFRATVGPARDASAAQSRRPATQVDRLRITDRGRIVLAAVALVAATVAGALVGSAFSNGPAMPEQTETVTVIPGQSLWSIADQVSGEGEDVRVVMDQIVALNELASTTVHAGQTLTVPAP